MGILSGNLAQRILSALIGAPLVIALALWHNFWGWQILIMAAVFLSLIEFANMAFKEEEKAEKLIMLLSGTLFSMFLITMYRYSVIIYPWAALFILFTIIFTNKSVEKTAEQATKTFTGVFYIAHLMSFAALVKLFPQGGKWIIYTLALIWAGDTGAYFTGKTLGKHKLAPKISPKKTWEGAIGGLIASVATGLGVAHFIDGFGMVHAIILSASAGIAGQIGDLAESMFKRSFGVKDSGNIIPGHGGILDRIDALLFAFPVVFAYLWLSSVTF